MAYPHKLPQQPQKTEFKRGKITPNSWGLDYHYVLQDKLKRLAKGIEKLTENFEYKGMVDTGALVDTAVAKRAGIGLSERMDSLSRKNTVLHVSWRAYH